MNKKESYSLNKLYKNFVHNTVHSHLKELMKFKIKIIWVLTKREELSFLMVLALPKASSGGLV